ncbi:Small-conductance mechanosensitive channel [Roseobacter denitrificans OCh 114]|nr:Small-conductance mechanosensitive channel [Roseobacter denitrificans OCh 114]
MGAQRRAHLLNRATRGINPEPHSVVSMKDAIDRGRFGKGTLVNFLSSFEMLDGNFAISLSIALLTIAWLGLKLFFRKVPLGERYPKLAVTADLVVLPLATLLVGRLTYNAHKWLELGDLSAFINALTLFTLLIVLGWCCARLVELFVLSKRKNDDATYLPGLQRGLLFAGFLLASAIAFFNIMDYSVTGIYLSTGALAALIAFAMQKTLGDLFSGIALSVEHPFRLGDYIELEDGTQGQITDINWRATRLRGWDNATVVVPNSTLAQQRINNMHGTNHPYAEWYEIKIPAEVDPTMAKALLLEAALRCDKLLKKPSPAIRLADATTIPYVYTVWVHFPNFLSMFAGREQLFREIHYALKNAGIQIAPETYELHSRRADVIKVEPPTALVTLKKLDIANFLTDEELEQLVRSSERLVFDAGTTIVAEGEVSHAFDIIVHGVVETSVNSGGTSSRMIGELKPGEYYGLYSMIADTPSFQQFAAATDVTVIRVHIECIRALLQNRPDLSEEFARIVKQRMDNAQAVRLGADKTPARLTFQDIMRRLDALMR